MPSIVAACVRLPNVWPSVSMIRSRSTSSIRRPTCDAMPERPVGAAMAGGPELDSPRSDLAAVRQQHRPMDRVLQLAHIAAPSVRRKPQAEPPRILADTAAHSRRHSGERSDRRAPQHRLAARAGAEYAATRRLTGNTDPRGTHRAAPRLQDRDWWWRGCAHSLEPARCRPIDRFRFSCNARSSFACRWMSISLISSSSSVPPSAASNLPIRRATAPENAPFSWPNSSDSSRFSGIAAQFSATNGTARRGANGDGCGAPRTSLPVPDFAGDQHRGFRSGHLFSAPHRGLHRRIAHHQRMRFAGSGFQDSGDQVWVGRQRQEFARAITDRLRRRLGIVAGTAGDNRHSHDVQPPAHAPTLRCLRAISHSTRSTRASARKRVSAVSVSSAWSSWRRAQWQCARPARVLPPANQ